MKKLVNCIIIAMCMMVTACGKGGDSGGNDTPVTPPPPTVPVPEAAVLVAPANNNACLNGIPASNNKVTISFSWQAAKNAEFYLINVKNLQTNEMVTYRENSTSTSFDVVEAQPYSWYIESQSSKTAATAKSAVWKFYAASDATSNYAPFPAVIVAPAANSIIAAGGAAKVSVVLKWDGADIDKDITSYSVYLDATNSTTNIIPSTANTTETVSLDAGKTYYWHVVTVDATGNTSDSGISSFTIQ